MTKAQKEAASKLNPRQKKFAEEYVKTGNITQSAIKAGYSESTARATGGKILDSTGVRKYIETLTSKEIKESEKTIADAEEIMQYFTRVMRGEEKDQFGLEASLSERTKAAQELAKRKVDVGAVEARVTIVNDIPRGEKK